jgi:hypothetical protein
MIPLKTPIPYLCWPENKVSSDKNHAKQDGLARWIRRLSARSARFFGKRGIPWHWITIKNSRRTSVCRRFFQSAFVLHIPIISWERCLNEHTHGLIRQHFPEKVSFDTLTQKQFDKIVAKINNQAHKVLGYSTPPYEAFFVIIFAFQKNCQK